MSKVITAAVGQVIITLYGDGVVVEIVYLGNDMFERREVKR